MPGPVDIGQMRWQADNASGIGSVGRKIIYDAAERLEKLEQLLAAHTASRDAYLVVRATPSGSPASDDWLKADAVYGAALRRLNDLIDELELAQ